MTLREVAPAPPPRALKSAAELHALPSVGVPSNLDRLARLVLLLDQRRPALTVIEGGKGEQPAEP